MGPFTAAKAGLTLPPPVTAVAGVGCHLIIGCYFNIF